ncbi:MAG: AMP-binding protein, partial [Anaerolineae bacterium]|nr:AMP-binding protein [Anaerolineae bacterium]
ASRLASIIEDCGIRAMVSQGDKVSVLQEVASQQSTLECVIGLDTNDLSLRTFNWDDVAQMPDQQQSLPRLTEHDLAYIMYTSGSTGKPKGIMHTHYSGLSYVRMSAATYSVGHDDRLSNHSPLHFDMSTFDYLTGPYCGATTIIIPEAYTLFPASLSKLIQDERMTIWYSVPFALTQLLLRGALDDRDLSSLRWILYGGEPFPLDQLKALMERLPNARVSNVYGPAEVNQCTYYHIPAPENWPDDLKTIPLGEIWGNAEGLIVDEHDGIIEDTVVGELVVRAPTMMLGYWQRPDLNERAFYRVQSNSSLEHVFYRTGDLVYRNDEGLLEFVGRKDHQVKIRGYRVELAEVDRILTLHDSVEQGTAYVMPDADGDKLGAAVKLMDGATIEAKDLLMHLQAHLPHYAVPDGIRFVTSFPRTGTGKVDRRALQAQMLEAIETRI